MSVHELPQNMSDWPDEPYQLLGVQPGVRPRDLRRAYTHLIRTFKPEQYPDHFRRIREAYEAILQHVEMVGFSERIEKREETAPVDIETVPTEPTRCSASPPAEDAAREKEQRIPAPVTRDLYKELHELWELACTGDEATAYQKLRLLQENHSSEDGVYFRLYWLLALNPELDVQRSPCDWLIAGIRAKSAAGPVWELYRRELADQPEEALSATSSRLMHHPLRPYQLLDLAGWRWQAAGPREEWDIIHDDLEVLRSRVLSEDEETWTRLLLLALDQFAWTTAPKPRKWLLQYCQEIEDCVHLHTRLVQELDRLDFLLTLSNDWYKMTRPGIGHFLLPEFWYEKFSIRKLQPLLQLVPLSWNRPFTDIRHLLMQFLQEVVRQPKQYMHHFVRLQSRSPAVLAQFGKLLYGLQGYTQVIENRSAEKLSPLIIELLGSSIRPAYPLLRVQLLDFCIREAIAPEFIAEIIDDLPVLAWSRQQHLSDLLNADWPLRYVCWAHRLYWA